MSEIEDKFNDLYKSLKETISKTTYVRPSTLIEFDISMDMGYAAAYNAEINCANRMIDFFNKYHLDYRCLIQMGLAIDATELNIY